MALKILAFIQYLVYIRFWFGILILIWILSLIFDTPMIQTLALYFDFVGAMNIYVL